MSFLTKNYITITNAGYTDTTLIADTADCIKVTLNSNLVLAADVTLGSVGTPPDGFAVQYLIVPGNGVVDLNGFDFTINGVSIDVDQLKAGLLFYNVGNGTGWDLPMIIPSFDINATTESLNGSFLIDASVALSKLEILSRGNIIVGDSSNRPIALDANNNGAILIGDGTDLNSVVPSGDITINSSGVTAIGSGVIVNADINASAAITRSKLATGTADYVVINSNTGVLSEEAQLATVRGGTGIDSSASTGFPVVSAGVWSVSSKIEMLTIPVSFETGEQCNNVIGPMPYGGTILPSNFIVTKALAATDSGTITFKINNINVTGGTITVPASSALETAVGNTPTALNTFAANAYLYFTTSKVTAGGKGLVTVLIERTS